MVKQFRKVRVGEVFIIILHQLLLIQDWTSLAKSSWQKHEVSQGHMLT